MAAGNCVDLQHICTCICTRGNLIQRERQCCNFFELRKKYCNIAETAIEIFAVRFFYKIDKLHVVYSA